MQLGTAKFIQLIFENLTCIAGNCFDVLWVRQLTLIGTTHGIQSFMHGTDGLINNWSTMVSKCGQQNIYPNIRHSQLTLLDLMTIVWENASCIGTQEMEGLDGHFFNGKLQYTIFAAGITWAPGLTLPATPISRLHFLCPDMMLFSLFLNYSLYIQCFAFHVLCPKWATARHTGAKSQTFRTLQSYRFCVFITFFFPGFPVFYVADLLGSLYPNGPVCYHLRPSSHTCLNAAA